MIRKVLAIVAACLIGVTLTGCGGGEDYSDAPKGGAKRPVDEGTRKPPGPGLDGESGLGTAGGPGEGTGDGG